MKAKIVKFLLWIIGKLEGKDTLIISGKGNRIEQKGRKGSNKAIIRGSDNHVIQRSED